jgi:tRNA G10  N-methylase Trm11
MVAEFSAPGDWVFDPFCGFGTTLEVAQRLGRQAIGFEYDRRRAAYAAGRVRAPGRVIADSIFNVAKYDLPQFQLLLTGIPYGAPSRGNVEGPAGPPPAGLPVDSRFSFREWNEEGFAHYLDDVRSIFVSLRALLAPSAKLVIEVCNVREQQRVRPVVWDVGRVLAELFHFEGEIVRCNTGNAMAGAGFNHNYLLVFTNREP